MKLRRKEAFTLIELMIVVAIIAIIAAIAIPSLLRSRITANETAAIGTLRSLVAAQEQFRANAEVDQDGDGAGEYGFLQELTGDEVPRGKDAALNPGEYITQVLGVTNNGIATKSGYCFQVFLPGADEAIPEADGAADADEDAADAQETRWICYAWPADNGRTGKRAFVVNQQGEVYQTSNDADDQNYDGQDTTPDANAALVDGTENLNGAIAGPGRDANDGGTWTAAGQ